MAPVSYPIDPDEMRYYREQASPFSFLYDMARENASELAGEGRRPILGGLLSKEPTYGLDTLQYEGIGPALIGLLSTIGKAIDAPYSAQQGLIPEADLVPEVMGTAGLAMGGGGLATTPKNSLRSGVSRTQSDLPPASNASEAMARQILELRAAGRSNEVTNEMMGAADNQYMFANTPLDMSQAARMARAKAEGRVSALHGTGSDISAVDSAYFGSGKEDLLGSGFYTTTNPKRADRYLPIGNPPLERGVFQSGNKEYTEGANVMPLMVKELKPFNLEEPLGDVADQIAKEYSKDPFFKVETMSSGVHIISNENGSAMLDPYLPKADALFKLRKAFGPEDVSMVLSDIGYSGVSGPEALGNRVRVNYNPADIRSQYARFDPEFSNLSNISAANRSKLGGLLAASSANKADLDPLGYQNTKMRDYLGNTDVALTDTGENLARKPMSWEETEGKVVLPFYGDRTSRGLLVEGVDDVKFDQPVYTEGGVDFMLGPAAQADNAVWASNQNIITRIDKEAAKAREKFQGKDILGVTGSMSPNANDFATMTGAAMAELVKGSKITKKAAKSFDKEMKSFDPDFVGILSPDLRKWAENTTSPKRKSFIRLIDTKPYQELGFPSSGQARYSVTDPTQRDMPAGMFGLGAARIGDLNPVLFQKPRGNMPPQSFPHSTYNTQITGDYLGSLPPVPQGLLFSDVYKSMAGKATKSGQPLNEAHKTHAIKTKMPAQVITPEVLEGILSYLSRMER